MKIDRYLELSKIVLDEAEAVENRKRASYTGDNTDILHNFKRDALAGGTSALQNLHGHMAKQMAAIASYVKNPEINPSETLLSRAADLINYCKLLVALAEDEGRVTGVENSEQVAPIWPPPNPPFYGSNVIPLTVGNTGVVPLTVGVVDHQQGLRDIGGLSTGMHDYMFGKDW